MATERICAYENCNNPLKEGAHGKRIYCSDKCRMAAHRAPQEQAKPIKQAPAPAVLGMTLEQLKQALETFPDQEAIKALCRQILGVVTFPDTTAIPQVIRVYDRTIRVPTLTPGIDDVPPRYLPPRPILNPLADKTRQMVEPEKGTTAWYLRHGDDPEEQKKGGP